MTTKPTNPKDAIGSGKIPVHLWPTTATIMGSLGLLDGAAKYGRSNWRESGARASIYFDAAQRHLFAWNSGEDVDPDSKLPHLAHALACLAILVDAQAADKLTDDREYPGGYRKLIEELTPHVARLKELHKDKNPVHFTKESLDPHHEGKPASKFGLGWIDRDPSDTHMPAGLNPNKRIFIRRQDHKVITSARHARDWTWRNVGNPDCAIIAYKEEE